MNEEIWKPIFGGVYAVSSIGRVRRVQLHRNSSADGMLKTARSAGYAQVVLYVGGKAVQRRVHTLVAEAFLGKGPEGGHVNHKNGDKTDDRLENLEHTTPGENTRHAVALGNFPMGARHYCAKLSEKDIAEIRRRYVRGSGAALAREFGVDQSRVSRIVSGAAWKSI